MEFEAPGDQKFDILNVMPDYGGAYLWGAYNESLGVGSNIATSWGGYEDHLPISEKLQNQFHQWQLLFDNTSFEDAGLTILRDKRSIGIGINIIKRALDSLIFKTRGWK